MSRILIITHVCDNFERQEYLLRRLTGFWARSGHEVLCVSGTQDWPEADLAILHVDMTVIPDEYVRAVGRYPHVVNGAALDISKRKVSRFLVQRGDGWNGPVIIKTDLNCGGTPELRVLRRAQRIGIDPGLPPHAACMPGAYPILRNAGEVSDAVWNHPGLVVERFLPERDPRGFWARAWVFLGDRERCSRYLCDQPIVKGANILAREPVDVPEELRRERERLGFDYGKFDFAMHEGRPVLFDANRTPGAPPPLPGLDQLNAELALGIESLLEQRR